MAGFVAFLALMVVMLYPADGAVPVGIGRRNKAGSLTGEIVDLSHCKDVKNNAIIFSPNITQLRSRGGEFIISSASFDVTRPAKSVSKGNIKFMYCSQGVAQTCETASNWRMGREACDLWVNKLTFWNTFADAIHPRFVCPFQQGHYVVTNLSLDMKKLEAIPLPLENREWSVTVSSFDDKEDFWVCFYIIVKLFRTRRRGA